MLNIFSGCSSLTSIEIPGSVKSIGDHAFYYCTRLQTILLENVVTIEDYAFSGSSYLTIVDIPSSVVSIGDYAFASQVNLQNITFHEGLKRIGKNAFQKCENLLSVSIPSSVEYIEDAVFQNCLRLSTVNASTIAPKYMGSSIFLRNAMV